MRWRHNFAHLSDPSYPVFAHSTAGIAPGLAFVLTTWYNRNEQNWVLSLLLAGGTLAGAFGGMRA
jgi:hypothetical protein